MTDIDALVATTNAANATRDDFNLDEYETVAERVKRFWADHPDGRVDTNVVSATGGIGETRWVVKAFIWKHRDRVDADATGLATETDSDEGVNATSALENAETSALGRALANAGYATDKRPTREEMTKAQRQGGRRRRRPRRPQQTTKLREDGDA